MMLAPLMTPSNDYTTQLTTLNTVVNSINSTSPKDDIIKAISDAESLLSKSDISPNSKNSVKTVVAKLYDIIRERNTQATFITTANLSELLIKSRSYPLQIAPSTQFTNEFRLIGTVLQSINETLTASLKVPTISQSSKQGHISKEIMDKIMAMYVPKSKVNITMDDIIGNDSVKGEIAKRIEGRFRYKDMNKYSDDDSNGNILLYGPPGTGKTMFARAAANMLYELTGVKVRFFSGGPSQILGSLLGDSEKTLDAVYVVGRQYSGEPPDKLTYMDPTKTTADEYAKYITLVFFDEVDGLLKDRNNPHITPTEFSILIQFLQSSTGISVGGIPMITMSATNFPQNMDEAAARRLGTPFIIRSPTRKDRWNLLKLYFTDKKRDPTKQAWLDAHWNAIKDEKFEGLYIDQYTALFSNDDLAKMASGILGLGSTLAYSRWLVFDDTKKEWYLTDVSNLSPMPTNGKTYKKLENLNENSKTDAKDVIKNQLVALIDDIKIYVIGRKSTNTIEKSIFPIEWYAWTKDRSLYTNVKENQYPAFYRIILAALNLMSSEDKEKYLFLIRFIFQRYYSNGGEIMLFREFVKHIFDRNIEITKSPKKTLNDRWMDAREGGDIEKLKTLHADVTTNIMILKTLTFQSADTAYTAMKKDGYEEYNDFKNNASDYFSTSWRV